MDMAEEALVNDGTPIDAQWSQICSQLSVEFGESAVSSWLKPLTIGGISDGDLRADAFFEKLGCDTLCRAYRQDLGAYKS